MPCTTRVTLSQPSFGGARLSAQTGALQAGLPYWGVQKSGWTHWCDNVPLCPLAWGLSVVPAETKPKVHVKSFEKLCVRAAMFLLQTSVKTVGKGRDCSSGGSWEGLGAGDLGPFKHLPWALMCRGAGWGLQAARSSAHSAACRPGVAQG